MFPAALWDVQAESTSKANLGRGVKWQRVEDVPDADQEAVVRYVIKDKLVGKPIAKRLDGITHGKVVFFDPSSSPVGAAASVIDAATDSSSQLTCRKKKSHSGNVSKNKFARENLSCSTDPSNACALVQVMIEFNGIKRGLDSMWHHMGVETNVGLCLHAEEAMFLMQAGEFRALCPDLRVLSVQHMQQLSRSPYRLFRAYSLLCGAGLRAVRHQSHVGITEYERKIKLDQHVRCTKAPSKKGKLKTNLESSTISPTGTVTQEAEDSVPSVAVEEEPTKVDLDEEMMAFYSSLEDKVVTGTPVKNERADIDEMDSTQRDPSSVSGNKVDVQLSEEWLLEYEESKREILKDLSSMNPYNGLCTIKKSCNFLPPSLKVLEEDYILWAADLLEPWNTRRAAKNNKFSSNLPLSNQCYNYHNWSKPITAADACDSEDSGPLDSDIETSSSSDSESISSLSESDSEDVSYQGWYGDWNNPIYMKRVTFDVHEETRSSVKRSLSLSDDSGTEEEEQEESKAPKVAKLEQPELGLELDHQIATASGEREALSCAKVESIPAFCGHPDVGEAVHTSNLNAESEENNSKQVFAGRASVEDENSNSKRPASVDFQADPRPESTEISHAKTSLTRPTPHSEDGDVSSSDSDSTSSSSSSSSSTSSRNSCRSIPIGEKSRSPIADVDMRPMMAQSSTGSAGWSSAAENFLKNLGETLEKSDCVSESNVPARPSTHMERGGSSRNGNDSCGDPPYREMEAKSNDGPQLSEDAGSQNVIQSLGDASVDSTISSVFSLIESVKSRSCGGKKNDGSLDKNPHLTDRKNDRIENLLERPNKSESINFKQSNIFPRIPDKPSSAKSFGSQSNECQETDHFYQLREDEPREASCVVKTVQNHTISKEQFLKPNGLTGGNAERFPVRLTRTMINNNWRLRVKAKVNAKKGTREICAAPSLADRLDGGDKEEEDVEDLRSSLGKKKPFQNNVVGEIKVQSKNPSHISVTVENKRLKRKRANKRLSRRARNQMRKNYASVNAPVSNVVEAAPNGLLRVNVVNNSRVVGMRTNVRDRLDRDENLTSDAFEIGPQREDSLDFNDSGRRLEESREDLYQNRQISSDNLRRYDSFADRTRISLEGKSTKSAISSSWVPSDSEEKGGAKCRPPDESVRKNWELPSHRLENGNLVNRGRETCSHSNRGRENYDYTSRGRGNIDYSNRGRSNSDYMSRGRGNYDHANRGRGNSDYTNRGLGNFDDTYRETDNFLNHRRGKPDFSNQNRGAFNSSHIGRKAQDTNMTNFASSSLTAQNSSGCQSVENPFFDNSQNSVPQSPNNANKSLESCSFSPRKALFANEMRDAFALEKERSHYWESGVCEGSPLRGSSGADVAPHNNDSQQNQCLENKNVHSTVEEERCLENRNVQRTSAENRRLENSVHASFAEDRCLESRNVSSTPTENRYQQNSSKFSTADDPKYKTDCHQWDGDPTRPRFENSYGNEFYPYAGARPRDGHWDSCPRSSPNFHHGNNNPSLMTNSNSVHNNRVTGNGPNLAHNNLNVAGNGPNLAHNHHNVVSNPNLDRHYHNLTRNNPNLTNINFNLAKHNPNVASNEHNLASNNHNFTSNNPYLSYPNPSLPYNNHNFTYINSNLAYNHPNWSNNINFAYSNPNWCNNSSNLTYNNSNWGNNNLNLRYNEPHWGYNNPAYGNKNPNSVASDGNRRSGGNAKQWQRLQRQRYKRAFNAQKSVLDQRVVNSVSSWRQYRAAVATLLQESLRDAPSSGVLSKGRTVPLLGPSPPGGGPSMSGGLSSSGGGAPSSGRGLSYDGVLAAIRLGDSSSLLSEWLLQQRHSAAGRAPKISFPSIRATYDVYMAKTGYSRSKETTPDLRIVVPRPGDDINIVNMIALRRHHADAADLTVATNAASAARLRHINFPRLLDGKLRGCGLDDPDRSCDTGQMDNALHGKNKGESVKLEYAESVTRRNFDVVGMGTKQEDPDSVAGRNFDVVMPVANLSGANSESKACTKQGGKVNKKSKKNKKRNKMDKQN